MTPAKGKKQANVAKVPSTPNGLAAPAPATDATGATDAAEDPRLAGPDAVPSRSYAERLRRRVSGGYTIDEFGLDVELIELLDPLFSMRWKVDIRGQEAIPKEGPAVIVANRRFGISEPVALGRGIRLATGRRVRFLGIPDVAPVGPVLRRMGGALNRPEEMASLLRMGHVVSVPLKRSLRRRNHAGIVPGFELEPAIALDVPVIPAAVVGHEWSRTWKVVIGAPLPRLAGGGPLAIAELADEARFGVQELLDDTIPPHWLFG